MEPLYSRRDFFKKTSKSILPILGGVLISDIIVSCGGDREKKIKSFSTQNTGWEKLNGKKLYLNTVRIGNEYRNWFHNGENFCYHNGYVYWNNKDDGDSVDEVYISGGNKLVWKKDTNLSMELISVKDNEVVTKGPAGLLREWSLSPVKTNHDSHPNSNSSNSSNSKENSYGGYNGGGSSSGCGSCSMICSYSCDTSCSSGCSSSCTGTCSGNCHGQCSGYCGNTCGTGCMNSCSGNCRSSCQEGCAIGCTGYSG